MADTLVLLLLMVVFISSSFYFFIKGTKLSKTPALYLSGILLLTILALFVSIGADKLRSDIGRVIRNSAPKDALEVYTVLFKKPLDSCVTVINFKDQVIPKFDCCIWMELKICPTELNRITGMKKYTKSRLPKSDSMNFIPLFGDRPQWWNPQNLGDSITKLHIQVNGDNEQTLLFGDDAGHLYVYDQAL